MEIVLESGLTANTVKTVCKSLQRLKVDGNIQECESQMLCLGKILEKYGGEEFTKDREFLNIFLSMMLRQLDCNVPSDLLYERTLYVLVSLISTSSSLINFQKNITDEKIYDIFRNLSKYVTIEGNRDTQEIGLGILGRIFYTFKKRRDPRLSKLKACLTEPLEVLFQDDISLLNALNASRQILNQINQENPNITCICIDSVEVISEASEKQQNSALWLDLGQRCFTIDYLNENDQSARVMIRYEDVRSMNTNKTAVEVIDVLRYVAILIDLIRFY